MKRTLFPVVILLFLLSCGQEKNTIKVSGELINGGGQMIYLKEMTSLEMITLDSVLIDTSGSFELTGPAGGISALTVSGTDDTDANTSAIT